MVHGPCDSALTYARQAKPFLLKFLYASPLGSHELDVASEVRALQGVSGLVMDVHVATASAISHALMSLSDGAILHITSHCLLVKAAAGQYTQYIDNFIDR